MRLKLDENLGRGAAARCHAAGHEVATVVDEGLAGCSDLALFEGCIAEERALITLDLGFADPFHFDPATCAGIAVLRVPDLPGRRELPAALDRLLVSLELSDITGRLWVVRADRVRQYEPE